MDQHRSRRVDPASFRAHSARGQGTPVAEQRDNRTTVEREVIRPADFQAARQPQATLVIYAHDDTRVVELSEGESVLVGRTQPADIIVEDLTISRRHARFTFRDGQIT